MIHNGLNKVDLQSVSREIVKAFFLILRGYFKQGYSLPKREDFKIDRKNFVAVFLTSNPGAPLGFIMFS